MLFKEAAEPQLFAECLCASTPAEAVANDFAASKLQSARRDNVDVNVPLRGDDDMTLSKIEVRHRGHTVRACRQINAGLKRHSRRRRNRC